MIFIVGALSVLIMSSLSDKIGRKNVLTISNILYLFGFLCVYLPIGAISYYIAVLAFFIYYFSYASVINVYIGEIFSIKLKSNITNFVMVVYETIGIIFSIVNIYITDYRDIMKIIALPALVCTFGYYQFIETPYFYYKNKNILNYIKSIFYINEKNNTYEISEKNKKKVYENLNLEEEDI